MTWLSFGKLTLELRDGDFVVGSASDVDWHVTTADLMPRHFVVAVRGRTVMVQAGAFESVIAVNGTQVFGRPSRLSDGDVVAAGSGRFVFSQDAPRVVAAEPADASDACLIAELAGIAYPLRNRSTLIGRDASNTIVVRKPTASRFHAEVRREAGGYALHSMGSAGTVLNNKLMSEPVLLKEGDTIEVAFTMFEFTEKELPPGIVLAERHDGENDDASRKPTLGTRVVDEDGAAVEGASPFWAIVGFIWFLFFTTLAWLRLRG